MLFRTCLGAAGLIVLCAIARHLRKHRRISGGVVLMAVMLSLQAVLQPSIQQVIAQQRTDDTEEDESGDADTPSSLESQLRRQAKRLRASQAQTDLTLRLPCRRSAPDRPPTEAEDQVEKPDPEAATIIVVE